MATKSLGQVVYLFKDNLVSERSRTDCHTNDMAQRARKEQQIAPEAPRLLWSPPPPSVFKAALTTRVKEARLRANLTQEQMADKLGIRQSKYSKYEGRSEMPHLYLARFCEVTGTTLKELLRDPR